MSLPTTHLSGSDVVSAIRTGDVSASAVVEEALARIADTHSRINAFTYVTAERARAEALAVDQAVAEGRDPGPLAGLTYSVKNLFDLEGVVTLAGSKLNRQHLPAKRDATCVARLKAAGAICLGAVNMGEYAYDFVTQNAHDGATHNPWDLGRSAGGSSGGSGAAIAAGLGAISIGTDTNGSIRVPSSLCGVWGLKPTYSRLSRAGSFPFVDSLDTIGPLGRHVLDLAQTYDVMLGPDERDPVCSGRGLEPALPKFDHDVSGLRVALLGGYFGSGGAPEVHAAARRVAAALGADREIELPQTALARTAAFTITASEAARVHFNRLKTSAGEFDPASRDRLLAGALLPAAWYLKAQAFRTWWREQVTAIFHDVDVLVAPATPMAAPHLGQQTMMFAGCELPCGPISAYSRSRSP